MKPAYLIKINARDAQSAVVSADRVRSYKVLHDHPDKGLPILFKHVVTTLLTASIELLHLPSILVVVLGPAQLDATRSFQ